MKIKLTREQTGKLVETWRRTHGMWESLEAVLMAYEEIRPKDAAPVMPVWFHAKYSHPTEADGLILCRSNNKANWIYGYSPSHGRDGLSQYCDQWMRIPEYIPADPTPEEKAEAEFEAWAKAGDYKLTRVNGLHVSPSTQQAYLGFMAAKFPAGKEGK